MGLSEFEIGVEKKRNLTLNYDELQNHFRWLGKNKVN
jgi:hypothetical protein